MRIVPPAEFYDALDRMFPEPRLTVPWLSATANHLVAVMAHIDPDRPDFTDPETGVGHAVVIPLHTFWTIAYEMTCARAGVMP